MSTSVVPAEILGGCHYLRTVGNLPVHIDRQNRIAVAIGGSIRAISMPEHWGYRTKEELRKFSITGPIVWHPFHRLTFLTRALDPRDRDVNAEYVLRYTDSVIIEPGRSVVLPTPGLSGRGWDTPIRDHFRPAMSSVLAALIGCADSERGVK